MTALKNQIKAKMIIIIQNKNAITTPHNKYKPKTQKMIKTQNLSCKKA